MAVFYKLCRTARCSKAHKAESVLMMGCARSVAMSSVGMGQQHRNFFVHFWSVWKEELQGCHVLQKGDDLSMYQP